eukprot:TRINITY_DN3460_c0_g1_i3.p1 TRINITY_DN3460_c0_g1~~TRINITY_DN3460_c0_g1_i3.p1  ORF type:complete len:927 (+),score=96.57 TRINITY_DN3460_c0_g1_i3:1250-4030(+)
MSWGLPFGVAISEIAPGAYVCNSAMIAALEGRRLQHFELPEQPNFREDLRPYVLDSTKFIPGQQVKRYAQDKFFKGFERPGGRGVATRNYVVILGVSSRSSSFCKQLAAHVRKTVGNLSRKLKNIDGIVSVTHTEGGTEDTPNNALYVIRTLCGLIIHPNVGAVLIVDSKDSAITSKQVTDFLNAHSPGAEGIGEQVYPPLSAVLHDWLSISDSSFDESLQLGASKILSWLDTVNKAVKTEQPLTKLKVALQCGGSDAFSGISGNPLAAWVAKEIIKYGGIAGMAETDELIGAETYFLNNARDEETARRFLHFVDEFKERVSWHGESAEGNPSGGNKLRGLYNICLKSLGASVKRDPEVCLDYVIDYSELMTQPGFYFMNSPGNDIESIAGQVASGANIIFFITGNGSITNFPFVPTLKIVTTTDRYNLMHNDMDVNAGAYLDGRTMAEIGQEMLDLTIRIASGERSKGESAGHSQVQIWRNWEQSKPGHFEKLAAQYQEIRNRLTGPVQPSGFNLKENTATLTLDSAAVDALTFRGFHKDAQGESWTTNQIALILPTSLCSGQVADIIAAHMNEKYLGKFMDHESGIRQKDQLSVPVTRFVALPHTEGCGCGGGAGAREELFFQTLFGYLVHPMVKNAVLLEHGCEATHNHYFMHRMEQIDKNLIQKFGWASVQMDGGIESAKKHVEKWFVDKWNLKIDGDDVECSPEAKLLVRGVGLSHLRLGLVVPPNTVVPPLVGKAFAEITRLIVDRGGTVVVPEGTALLSTPSYINEIVNTQIVEPSLLYGQSFVVGPDTRIGRFHVMQCPTHHWVETITGLGATGVEIIVSFIGEKRAPLQANPLIPVIQATTSAQATQPSELRAEDAFLRDFDIVFQNDQVQGTSSETITAPLLGLVLDVASGTKQPRMFGVGNCDFQLTRGDLGVSL